MDLVIGRSVFRNAEHAKGKDLSAMRRAFRWQRHVVTELLVRARIAQANNGPASIIRQAHEEYRKLIKAQETFKSVVYPNSMRRVGDQFRNLAADIEARRQARLQ